MIADNREMIFMIQAVLFDLDGVLVSTDEMHYRAWKRLAEDLHIDDFTREDNLRQRGVSRMESLEVLLEKSPVGYTPQEKEQLAERKNEYFTELLKSLSPKDVLPGALSLIHTLKQNGILVAVGSSSKNAPQILHRTGLEQYLDGMSCGLDITKSKPDPQVFLVAAKRLGVSPSDCLVVEDSDSGIQAAKTGGMYSLAVGSASRNPDADFRAETLEQFDVNEILPKKTMLG